MENDFRRLTSQKRALVAALAVACLLAGLVGIANADRANSAPLRILVLGKTADTPQPDCPGKYQVTPGGDVTLQSCLAEGHVTGFQVSTDGVNLPIRAPFDGKIVSWSISLGKPSAKDTENSPDSSGIFRRNELGFFNGLLGRPSEARIAILRPIEHADVKTFKMVRQSPLELLNPYFGTTPQFVLDHPLTVVHDQIVALTVPTWAPMFASAEPGTSTWRGSRIKGSCRYPTDSAALAAFVANSHPQQKVGSKKTYTCLYVGQRLLYTATLIKKPGS